MSSTRIVAAADLKVGDVIDRGEGKLLTIERIGDDEYSRGSDRLVRAEGVQRELWEGERIAHRTGITYSHKTNVVVRVAD